MNTPENIDKLEPNQIFVFGSNLAGIHGKGAALTARQKFGAKQGTGKGLTGQCYAFPTKDHLLNPIGLKQIAEEVEDLYYCAKEHPGLQFLVTKVGTGYAGYTKYQIRSLFNDLNIPSNIILPKEFE